MNANAGSDIWTKADLRPKQNQQASLEAVWPGPRRKEEPNFHEVPANFDPAWAPTVEISWRKEVVSLAVILLFSTIHLIVGDSTVGADWNGNSEIAHSVRFMARTSLRQCLGANATLDEAPMMIIRINKLLSRCGLI